jgi:16S rRNA (cytosine1402-N4)-methyltransferase
MTETRQKKTKHVPVLLQEVINTLDLKPSKTFVDVTLGGGGHFLALLRMLNNEGLAFAFDEDIKAIKRMSETLQDEGFKIIEIIGKKTVLEKEKLKVTLIRDNFVNYSKWIEKEKVDGVLADLGLSTDQVEDENEGFSFLNDDSILDMRLDKSSQVRACDLINGLYKKELERLFTELADVSFAKKLTNEIIKQRSISPLTKVGELKNIIQRIVPFYLRRGANKHPEAKVFQALRIAVNHEFSNLRDFLPQAFETLASGGKLCVITFHSGEDRIVKNYFRELTENKKAHYESGEKYIEASEKEIELNKKSHSAKMRFITKN